MVLALALKTYRINAGLTQAALARLLRITTQMVSLLECGRVAPSTRLLRRIVDLLDLDGPTVKAVLLALPCAPEKRRPRVEEEPPLFPRTGSDA